MTINESVLNGSEKVIFALRQLCLSNGYSHYRMSKFEEYDLYAGNKDFLVSDNVITFTDTDGKLMALKPDVTLSIIKNSGDEPEVTRKVFYNENVYRVSEGTGSFKEIMQAGVECFGKVGDGEVVGVLRLACESLRILSEDSVLAVSDLDLISALADRIGLNGEERKKLFAAVAERNPHEIEKLCSDCADRETVGKLKKLISLHGPAAEVLPKIPDVLGEDACARFSALIKELEKTVPEQMLTVDFSVTGDTNYYNGIVFKGFLRDIPTAVLSGGQYDNLMKKFRRRSRAVGFAVYTDLLDRYSPEDGKEEKDGGFVNIALPKGRLGEKIYGLFAEAGFECPALLEPNRKLIFENPEKKVRYFWVKPSDVAIYVERGAADIGVAGKDILLEYEPDIYELLDLKKGKCRMAVAAPKGYTDDPSSTLKVATKFSGIAKKYYRSRGRNIDIIHLNGSIEIAPILGLSDVIVDIVETGATLRENDLEVVEEILPISARLIANKSSYKFKSEQIEKIAAGLAQIVAAELKEQ